MGMVRQRRKKNEKKSSDFFRKRLLLFLSVDLVGSTAFKQAHSNSNLLTGRLAGQDGQHSSAFSMFAPWASEIANFYRQFPFTFKEEYIRSSSDAKEDMDLDPGPQPELWKAIGDELVFKKEITDSRQVVIVILAWIESLNIVREKLRSKKLNLNLKSSAWMAGFPVANSEIIFQKDIDETEDLDQNLVKHQMQLIAGLESKTLTNGSYFFDYLGPSIDAGFRLGQFASPRKLVTSVEVAHVLAAYSSLPLYQKRDFKPCFYLDNYVELKGVLGGAPYPVFWLDLQAKRKINEKEDKITGKVSISCEDVAAFCNAFYEEHQAYIFKPFVESDRGHFGQKPPQYDKLYDVWTADMDKLSKLDEAAPEHKGLSVEPDSSTNGTELNRLAADKVAGISRRSS